MLNRFTISLTGSTAAEGTQTRNGYELWAEAVNKAGGISVGGKRYLVELKVLDDQSSGETSAQLAEKLIKEQKVNFLLGPYGTTPTLTVSRVAEQNGIPMVEGNGAAGQIFNQGYKYTFGVLNSIEHYTFNMLKMASEAGLKRLALLNENQLFSQLGIDGAVNEAVNVFANYSYQALPDPDFDLDEVNLPPTNRFNVGFNFSQGRYLGNLAVSYVDDAFWQDVLDARFHGTTKAYTQVNGAVGVKFSGDKVTASIKAVNLLNEDIQSHVFGDIVKRQVIGELRFAF